MTKQIQAKLARSIGDLIAHPHTSPAQAHAMLALVSQCLLPALRASNGSFDAQWFVATIRARVEHVLTATEQANDHRN